MCFYIEELERPHLVYLEIYFITLCCENLKKKHGQDRTRENVYSFIHSFLKTKIIGGKV